APAPAAPPAPPAAAPAEVPELPGAAVRLARCCTPVPPDEVTGIVLRGGAVAVHRAGCPTGTRMLRGGRRAAAVRWLPGGAPQWGYRATLHAEALNRPRLLADLTAAISGEGVSIFSAEVEPPRQLRVRHSYTLELPDAAALPAVMRAVLRVSGVYDVYRPGGPEDAAGAAAGAEAAAGKRDDSGTAGVQPSWGIHGGSAVLSESTIRSTQG
ncbi:ACT domain-containing protein, partial [Kitasatospora phosalacinea]|uniref:ACT domain-containing protein n=1 Tax=Kitasatospora phosalacinea TaxID=2065 RepID=UPI0035E043A8